MRSFGSRLTSAASTVNTPAKSEPSSPLSQHGATRLPKIPISEAAHIVCVLHWHCEKGIQDKNHSDGETKARWLKAINERLACDRVIATKIKRRSLHKPSQAHMGTIPPETPRHTRRLIKKHGDLTVGPFCVRVRNCLSVCNWL